MLGIVWLGRFLTRLHLNADVRSLLKDDEVHSDIKNLILHNEDIREQVLSLVVTIVCLAFKNKS